MATHYSTTAMKTISTTKAVLLDKEDESNEDYEIVGTFKDSLYTTYDDLLVKVNDVLKKASSKKQALKVK